ncbi:MAG: co-chaperone GroES [Proteobacteria bacterium]|nr:co-chaperone GroES [Pseudomonadota bacterium]
MSRFKPMRGKVAIKEDEVATQTESGIYYEEKKTNSFTTGIVMSIGLPVINNKGLELDVSYKEGDRVLVEQSGGHHVSEYMVLDQEKVIAVISKDTKIGR